MRRYPLPLLAILLIGIWTGIALAAGQAPAANEKAVFFVA